MSPLRGIGNVMPTLARGQKTLPQSRPRADSSNRSPGLDRGILQDSDFIWIGAIHGQEAVAEGDKIVDELHALQAQLLGQLCMSMCVCVCVLRKRGWVREFRRERFLKRR